MVDVDGSSVVALTSMGVGNTVLVTIFSILAFVSDSVVVVIGNTVALIVV